MNDKDFGVVIISAPAEKAPVLAKALVQKRLGACVQVLPGVESYYWWEEEVQHEPETLLFIKTRHARLRDIQELMKELHPYEVPEIVFLPITDGLEPYLTWISENTGDA